MRLRGGPPPPHCASTHHPPLTIHRPLTTHLAEEHIFRRTPAPYRPLLSGAAATIPAIHGRCQFSSLIISPFAPHGWGGPGISWHDAHPLL